MDKKAIGSLCFADEDSDVKLIFKGQALDETLTIPVHTLVLKRTSGIFKNMLDSKNQFLEHNTGEIVIDVFGDVTIGLYFVKYLYTRTLPSLEMELNVMLMKMGHTYQISGLSEACEKILMSSVTPFSVCKLYQSVQSIASTPFRLYCINFMLKSAFLIFMHKRHLMLHERTMKLLLENNALNVLNEEQTLTALWQWGLVRCIQENEPGNINPAGTIVNLLPYIRWHDIPLVQSNSPWFDLVREWKAGANNPTRRNNLTLVVSPNIQLNSFARKLQFDSEGEGSPMTFKKEGKYTLMFFTSSFDIVLTGFTFVVGFRSQSAWKDCLRLLFNQQLLNDQLLSKVSRKNYFQLEQQKTEQVYIYDVEVEFVKPVLIQKACFNVLEMCVNEKSTAAFPQFTLKSETFPLSLDNLDKILSVRKKVSSLTSVFYFITI